MERWIGKTAVVTGASGGIGAAIALQLAREGMVVIALARRLEKLQDLSTQLEKGKGIIHGIKFDVSDVDEIPALLDGIIKRHGGIDVLVNNAGIVRSDKLCESSTEDCTALLKVNLLSVAIFSREAIKSMRTRNVPGHIFNLNSFLGHTVAKSPDFYVSLYPTTKYGITGLSETLRGEMSLLGTMIKITSISPGLVKTDIFENGKIEAFCGSKINNVDVIEPENVAEALVYALSTPPTVLISEMCIRHVKELF